MPELRVILHPKNPMRMILGVRVAGQWRKAMLLHPHYLTRRLRISGRDRDPELIQVWKIDSGNVDGFSNRAQLHTYVSGVADMEALVESFGLNFNKIIRNGGYDDGR